MDECEFCGEELTEECVEFGEQVGIYVCDECAVEHHDEIFEDQ